VGPASWARGRFRSACALAWFLLGLYSCLAGVLPCVASLSYQLFSSKEAVTSYMVTSLNPAIILWVRVVVRESFHDLDHCI